MGSQNFEQSWGRDRIGAVVEGQRYRILGGGDVGEGSRKAAQNMPEDLRRPCEGDYGRRRGRFRFLGGVTIHSIHRHSIILLK